MPSCARAANIAPPLFSLPPVMRPVALALEAFAPNAIGRLTGAIRPHHRLERLAPALLLWLLFDKELGLINLTGRDDVRQALAAALNVLRAQALGETVPAERRELAEQHAESAKSATWRAMRFRLTTTGCERVEWMTATAIVQSVDRQAFSPAEAFHCAMVAWGTPVAGRTEISAPALACAALDFLVAVLDGTPA